MSFTDDNKALFTLVDASEVLDRIAASVEHEIDRIDASDLRANTDSDLTARTVQKLRVQPIQLIAESLGISSHLEVAVTAEGGWCRIDDPFRPSDAVRGVRLKVTIRYEGLGTLWSFKPGPDWNEDVRGNVHEEGDVSGVIEIIFNVPGEPSKETISALVDSAFGKLRRGVTAIADIIQRWNANIERHSLAAIAERRRFLDVLLRLPELVEIPLVVRNGRVTYEPIELRRRAIEIVATPDEPAPERRYGISDSGYQNALHVIRHFGRSFEQTPGALGSLHETQLRDLFLAALSTYFDSASGERFRRNGKADIVIEEQSQEAFVAECKLWRGIRSLEEAIRQITELYTTWQDCKCAILLFNRTRKDITKVASTVSDYLRQHSQSIGVDEVAPGEWRVRIRRRDDANNLMSIQVFLFDVSVRTSEVKELPSED